MELQEQLRLFPRPGIQVLQLCFVIKIIGVIKILGLFGTEADAAVALHALAGHQVGVLRVNGPQRTFPGAQAALGTGVRGFGFHREDIDGVSMAVPGGVVGAHGVVALHGNRGKAFQGGKGLHFVEDLIGKSRGDGADTCSECRGKLISYIDGGGRRHQIGKLGFAYGMRGSYLRLDKPVRFEYGFTFFLDLSLFLSKYYRTTHCKYGY